MRLKRLGQFLFAVPLAAACATTQGGTSRELVEARAAYARAAASPAATDAPRALEDARRSLIAAERVNRDDPKSRHERHLAYVAKQRAELAIAKAETRRAERVAQLARIQLSRNAGEAARAAELAKAQAEAAKAQADAASQQLQQATEQRVAAERDLSTMRTDLARLETELQHTRDQLAQKGDQLDAQTQQLKDREVSLQAQIAQLRVAADRAEQLKKERDQALATLREFATIEDDDDRGVVITVPSEVMFRTGSAKLLPPARDKLDQLAEALGKLGTEQMFVIEGHTDSRGSAAYNRRLSKKRAESVRDYLIEQGVDGDRIVARGRGEAVPVAANTSVEGRAINRRVEIVVTPEGTTEL